MQDLELEEALKSLRQEYAQALPERIQEIQTVWHELDGDHWNGDQFATFITLTHRLAGSGATYGFARVTETARALEMYAKGLETDAVPSSEECEEICRRLAILADSWH